MAISTLSQVTPREAAYLAFLAASREEQFIAAFLLDWQIQANPSSKDFRLAQEIAHGSMRMQNALDFLGKGLTTKDKLQLKGKEKALLRTALYQYVYMDRVPIYAIANESANIAKKYCHPKFVDFLNAILRKLPQEKLQLPQGNNPETLCIRLSYPKIFVETLIKELGQKKAIEALKTGNRPPQTTVRWRTEEKQKTLINKPFPVTIEKDISELIHSEEVYIQNVTPVQLMGDLFEQSQIQPKNILDLCASPGGKSILAHDLFPDAILTLNDVSPKKIKTIEENLLKYHIQAKTTCSLGQEFPSNEKYDLIILDVPCSNTGVLNKRSEARWRLTPEKIQELEKTQLELLKKASKLLTVEGVIWYLTCSILSQENSALIEKACNQFSFKCLWQKTHLPNLDGWDGGFGALIKIL